MLQSRSVYTVSFLGHSIITAELSGKYAKNDSLLRRRSCIATILLAQFGLRGQNVRQIVARRPRFTSVYCYSRHHCHYYARSVSIIRPSIYFAARNGICFSALFLPLIVKTLGRGEKSSSITLDRILISVSPPGPYSRPNYFANIILSDRFTV